MPDVGIIVALGVDASQAQSDMDAFTSGIVGSSSPQIASAFTNQVTPAIDGVGKSLVNSHQSVHLLAEEMGIHLPRAVVGAISEMLPSISSLGTGLLAAFAVGELVKFTEHLHELSEEYNGVAAAEKALNDAGRENVSILEDQSKKSIEYARSQVKLLLIASAQADVAVDQKS